MIRCCGRAGGGGGGGDGFGGDSRRGLNFLWEVGLNVPLTSRDQDGVTGTSSDSGQLLVRVFIGSPENCITIIHELRSILIHNMHLFYDFQPSH